MADDVKGTRAYRSPLRDERARRTRARMVTAATELFLDGGFARTTVPEVADRAGVSADLVFHVFGSKRALLKEVLDVGVGGDDEQIDVLERVDPQLLRTEPDPVRQLGMLADGIAGQLERVGPLDAMLRDAAVVDPDLAALRADLQLRQRRSAMRTIVGWLGGALVLDEDHATDIVWTLTSPDVHRLLTHDCGWSRVEYAAWLASSLRAALLPQAQP